MPEQRANGGAQQQSGDDDGGAQQQSVDDDGDSSNDSSDGVVLDRRLIQTAEVRALEADAEYQALKRQTHKARKANNKQKKFNSMRQAIRLSAQAAREAYIAAKEAEPNTPDVTKMLQVLVPGTCVRCIHQVISSGHCTHHAHFAYHHRVAL